MTFKENQKDKDKDNNDDIPNDDEAGGGRADVNNKITVLGFTVKSK